MSGDKRPAMADDIATRLRHAEDNGICEWQVLIDAADEIERLRADVEFQRQQVVRWIDQAYEWRGQR